jgi:hypothetical protein
MRGDFSRETFDPVKHFSRVLQQQGRVHLDADWNEQTAIVMHYLRTLAADLIGPFAGPAGEGFGFKIDEVSAEGFAIGRGRYYVDGILCENETATTRYENQADLPFPPELEKGTAYLVYLDVWERHVTALEDDDIREKALGGADTATRAKIVWQVKAVSLEDISVTQPGPAAIRKNWGNIVARLRSPLTGCLRARVDQPKGSNDPCLTAPDSRYRGAENQLYRVEVHKGGPAGEATFKWSRNNGAIATRVTLAGTELTAENARGFAAGQWVELTSDAQELRGLSGRLVKLLKVDGERFSLESPVPVPDDVVEGEQWPTKARSWDQRKNSASVLEDGAVPITESVEPTGWIGLEDGIQVQFRPASADGTKQNVYRPGDYWLIPARTATGGIEWPVSDDDAAQPLPRSPRGIRHHFAPLATLTAIEGGWTTNDCRSEFAPVKNSSTPVINSFGDVGMSGPAPCEPPEEPVDG